MATNCASIWPNGIMRGLIESTHALGRALMARKTIPRGVNMRTLFLVVLLAVLVALSGCEILDWGGAQDKIGLGGRHGVKRPT